MKTNGWTIHGIAVLVLGLLLFASGNTWAEQGQKPKKKRKPVSTPSVGFAKMDIGGEVLFAERGNGRDYLTHYYANFGYSCSDENYWLHGEDGGRLMILNPVTGKARGLMEDEKGAFRDPRVSYDAKKVLFSYRKGGTHYYNLYESNIDGTGLKQLTFGDWDDIEPCYLPDGDIMFCSTRCKRYVLCWLSPVTVLFRCKPDGSDIRQISSGANVESTPAVLHDGRIAYTRWEYVNRATTRFHQLWVINPDGTGAATFFGNMHPTHAAYIDARAISGTGNVVYVSASHGSNEHAGHLVLLDPSNGPDDMDSARTFASPGRKQPGLRDPYPVSPSLFLATCDRELRVVTDKGEQKCLYRSRYRPVHEPQLIVPREREPVVPSQVDWSKKKGTLFLSNVYIGRNMKGVKPGSIKKLLVMEQLSKPVNFHGGGSTPIAHGGKWTLNRILGTVPVEDDGSASFEVPAGRSIYLGILDESDLSVKQMRSFITVMPGENASCVGCHEDRTMPPPRGRNPVASRRAPSKIEPIAGVPEIIEFPRDVQPILDKHCVSCHNPDKRSGGVTLTGDRGPTYSLSYYNLMLHRQVIDQAGLGWPGVHDRNKNGEPLGNDTPYETFSSASPLMKKIDGSHHDVKLSIHEQTMIRLWLDSATPYAGTYAAYGTGQIGGWSGKAYSAFKAQKGGNTKGAAHILAAREMTDNWPSTGPAKEAMEKRCMSCHKGGMPRFVTDTAVNVRWNDMIGFMRPVFRTSRHRVFNLTRPEKSLVLMAVLDKEAGGYADGAPSGTRKVGVQLGATPKPFVHHVIFESTDDPDYQAILAHVRAAGKRLDEIKRFDMPGFQPRYEYVREMKRYGVLPGSYDLQKPDPVDPYELDLEYFELFYPESRTDL